MPSRTRLSRTTAAATRKSLELAIAAPAVVALRSAGMIAAGAKPRARDRREILRMGSEKAQAFGESWFAMMAHMQREQMAAGFALWRYWQSLWLAPWQLRVGNRLPGSRTQRAWARRMANSAASVLDRGLAPLHRTATANARRLARRR
jgi:hypothetical protein